MPAPTRSHQVERLTAPPPPTEIAQSLAGLQVFGICREGRKRGHITGDASCPTANAFCAARSFLASFGRAIMAVAGGPTAFLDSCLWAMIDAREDEKVRLCRHETIRTLWKSHAGYINMRILLIARKPDTQVSALVAKMLPRVLGHLRSPEVRNKAMEVITCVNNRAKGAAVRVHAVSQSCGCCRAIDLQSRDYGNADCARLDASPQGVKLPLKELLEVFAAADASPF